MGISSRLGMGGLIRNITWLHTKIERAGIAINVDLYVTKDTNTSLLSTVDGIRIHNLSASGIGCLPEVTPGFYCGGAGCLLGNHFHPIRNVSITDVNITGLNAQNGSSVGWMCTNVSGLN